MCNARCGEKAKLTNSLQSSLGRAASSYHRPRQEMQEKPWSRDSFFSLKAASAERPMSQPSVHTEFMGTDWEMDGDDDHSEFEEGDGDVDGDNSPRASLHSVGFSLLA